MKLDQHFTDDQTAARLVSSVIRKYDPGLDRVYLEPSCGSGSFVRALEQYGARVKSIDIDPKMDATLTADFLETLPTDLRLGKLSPDMVITIGNPPFGRAGAVAKKFINHAALFSNVICMVSPLSMLGARNCKVLDSKIELTYEEELVEASFSDTNAKCCWQEWFVRLDGKAKRPDTHNVDPQGLYELVGPDDRPNLVIQRCGGGMGNVTQCNGTGQGKYYIRSRFPEVIEAFKHIHRFMDSVPEAKKMTHQGTLSHYLLHRLLKETLAQLQIERLTR